MLLDNIRIVLIQPQFPGNIGAVARAMKNMGLTRLYLVNPAQFPHKDAFIRATNAHDVLENAVVADSLSDVIKNCRLVIGTSTRGRGCAVPALTARETASKIIPEAKNSQVALLFGTEASGMTGEDIKRCNYYGYIPANPEYTSLNLAAAVQTFCYEIFQATDTDKSGPEEISSSYPDNQQLEYFYQHLEQVLLASGFIIKKHPGQIMARLRRLFARARPDEKEMNILRGILSSIEKKL